MPSSETYFRKGRKKTGGRKKGSPNKIKINKVVSQNDVRDIFQTIVNFITPKDLYNFYNKLKKSPYLMIQFLKMLSPADIRIFFPQLPDNNNIDYTKLNQQELNQLLKLLDKAQNKDVITIESE